MVETGIDELPPNQHEIRTLRGGRLPGGLVWIPSALGAHRRRWSIVVLVAVILLAAPAVAVRPLGLLGGTQAARASMPPARTDAPVHNRPAERAPAAVTPPASASRPLHDRPPAPTTTTATAPTAPAPAPTPAAPVPTNAPIAALVAQVEAAGVDPGATWTWTMGDTTTQCGVISRQRRRNRLHVRGGRRRRRPFFPDHPRSLWSPTSWPARGNRERRHPKSHE